MAARISSPSGPSPAGTFIVEKAVVSMIMRCLRDARLRWSAHAARTLISARRNRQARLKVTFAAICVAAKDDDDEAVPVAEGWMVCEESPQWLQPLENSWVNIVGDPQDRTSMHAQGENRMALNKAFCFAS